MHMRGFQSDSSISFKLFVVIVKHFVWVLTLYLLWGRYKYPDKLYEDLQRATMFSKKTSTPGQASSALNPHRSQVEKRMHGMTSAVLTEMREKRELCDLEIQVGKVKIDAHKVILCSCSSYFRWVLHLRRAKAVKSYTFSLWKDKTLKLLTLFVLHLKIKGQQKGKTQNDLIKTWNKDTSSINIKLVHYRYNKK